MIFSRNGIKMNKIKNLVPDSTAVRVALWRAMHVELDDKPHVFEDQIGLRLIAPDDDWKNRLDMHPEGTRPFRASIVLRSRFIEDLVQEESSHNICQYVLLGSGLDTFAQRRPQLASKLKIFEIDKSLTLNWKKQRLLEEGFEISSWLKFVPVDFESNASWWQELLNAGFDSQRPAIVTSIGVSMYLTIDAIKEMLQQIKQLKAGSKFIMTFMLPLDLVEPQDRFGYEMSLKGTKASGTPFISFFSPQEMLHLAKEMGFEKLEHLSSLDLAARYLKGRTDGLWPSSGEEFLIITI
jgi:methyltransferase (TIGR00027 family)